MRKLLFGFIFSLMCSAPSLADWEYRDIYDEMRGSRSYDALLPSEKKEDVSGYMFILLSSDDNKIINNAGLILSEGNFDCKVSTPCSGFIKYENNQVHELTIHSDSHVAIFDNSDNFLRQLVNINTLFIELPIEGKGTQQFKFKTSGLKWKVE